MHEGDVNNVLLVTLTLIGQDRPSLAELRTLVSALRCAILHNNLAICAQDGTQFIFPITASFAPPCTG